MHVASLKLDDACDLSGQKCYLGSPGEPQLEDVVVASALDDFVARVIRHVVVFVLLEQVISTHAITVVQ